MRKLIYLSLVFISTSVFAQEPTEPTDTEALLTVDVKNTKGAPSIGDLVTFTSQKTGKMYSGTTGDDGMFKILIPKGSKYTVSYRSFDKDNNYSEIDVPVFDGFLTFNFSIKYDMPRVYTLDNVYFDTGKASLRPNSYASLDNLAELMLAKKAMVIEIAGHTDDVGEDDSNMRLSLARAESVKAYLIKKGIEASRVKAKGYGETQPVADNGSEQGRQKNRRTEVRIISE